MTAVCGSKAAALEGHPAAAQALAQSGARAPSTSARCPRAWPLGGSPKAAANLRVALCLLLSPPPHLRPLETPATRGSSRVRWRPRRSAVVPASTLTVPATGRHHHCRPQQEQSQPLLPQDHGRLIHHKALPSPSAWTAPLRVLLEMHGPVLKDHHSPLHWKQACPRAVGKNDICDVPGGAVGGSPVSASSRSLPQRPLSLGSGRRG